jgi:hypothetical protein
MPLLFFEKGGNGMKYIEAIKNLEQGGITLKPITLPHTSTYVPV